MSPTRRTRFWREATYSTVIQATSTKKNGKTGTRKRNSMKSPPTLIT